MLRWGVTRTWVDEGQLSKEQTKSKVEEALGYADRGHTWRECSLSSSDENLNTIEISPRCDMVQQIVVEQLVVIQYMRKKSCEGLDYAKLDMLRTRLSKRTIELDSQECHSATKVDLPIAKKGA
ncbi:hypothetical protein B296_00042962 [Ensete ventricosum]|uniref:Uncharacterized protein n=1 Tax=Ensete ventricosum TaxID=4639 RepID=A0A426ZGI8_ENSVE|nr:hypothetical protein B296_00042962 [Ensete ventricosum]